MKGTGRTEASGRIVGIRSLLRGCAWPACAAACLTSACILEPEDVPAYPTELVLAVQTDSLPGCALVDAGDSYALAASGSSAWLLGCEAGELSASFQLGREAVDVAVSGAAGAILTGDSLVPVDCSSATMLPAVGMGGSCVACCPGDEVILVLRQDGTLLGVDAASWTVSMEVRTGLAGCTAMAADSQGDAVFLLEPVEKAVYRIEVPTGSAGPSYSPGPAIGDLEGCADGSCITVDGSNELWLLGPDCQPALLLTLPEEPFCGDATSDLDYFYAGCPTRGLVICSSSGEQVYSAEFWQGIGDISISPSGGYALMGLPGQIVLLGLY